MSLRPRPEVEGIQICPHGGPDYAELTLLGFKPSEILDFSVSANPFGPPEGLREAIASAAIDRYPDSQSMELKRALSAKLGVGVENIIVGNGSMEMIRLAASAYLERRDAALILGPTFGEYQIACAIAGCRTVHYVAPESNGFNFDVEEIIALIDRHRPKVVFLCNPNNPTGRYLGRDDVLRILSACENALLVLDEAYIAFTQSPWNALDLISGGNLLILRSMTKDYALAGLRLGYAVAGSDIIAALGKVSSPWSVNVMAQNAGLIALADGIYLRECQQGVREAGDFLREGLEGLGLHSLPSDVHFFLVGVSNATGFRKDLLGYGIMVRDCTSFGLPQHVRISPRTLPECRKLMDAVGRIPR